MKSFPDFQTFTVSDTFHQGKLDLEININFLPMSEKKGKNRKIQEILEIPRKYQ